MIYVRTLPPNAVSRPERILLNMTLFSPGIEASTRIYHLLSTG